MARHRRLAVLATLLLVAGCHAACQAGGGGDTDASPSDAADAGEVTRIPVTIDTASGAVVFQAEVADSPAERQKGLMFRESLGEREGMLFLFPVEQQLSFWMKNTYIPLDMIFIKADRTILGIVENAEPMTTTGRSVPGNSQFVLEIKGGLSEELGIETGQTVSFFAETPSQ